VDGTDEKQLEGILDGLYRNLTLYLDPESLEEHGRVSEPIELSW
jgi:hypothetical protein